MHESAIDVEGVDLRVHARLARLSRLLEKRQQTRLALQFLSAARADGRCPRVAAAIGRAEASIRRLREAQRVALLLLVIGLEDGATLEPVLATADSRG